MGSKIYARFYHVRQRAGASWTYVGTFPTAEGAQAWAQMTSKEGADCRVYAQDQGKRRNVLLGVARGGTWFPERQVLSE